MRQAYLNDPAAKAAYAQERTKAQRAGSDVPDPVTFLHLGAQAGHVYSYRDERTGKTNEFNPGVLLAKTASRLDENVAKPIFR